MKRYLNFLAILPIIGASTATVVACGEENENGLSDLSTDQIINLVNKYKTLITTSVDKYFSLNSDKMVISKEQSFNYTFLNYYKLENIMDAKKDESVSLNEEQILLLSEDFKNYIFNISEVNSFIENELKNASDSIILKQFRKPGDFTDVYSIKNAELLKKENTINISFEIDINFNFLNENFIQNSSTMAKTLNINIVSTQQVANDTNTFSAILPSELFEQVETLNLKPTDYNQLFKYSNDWFYQLFNEDKFNFQKSIENLAGENIEVKFKNFEITDVSIINDLYNSNSIVTKYNFDSEIANKLLLRQNIENGLDVEKISQLLLEEYKNSYDQASFSEYALDYFKTSDFKNLNLERFKFTITYGSLLINGITLEIDNDIISLSPIRTLFNYGSVNSTTDAYMNNLVSSFDFAFKQINITKSNQPYGLWSIDNSHFWDEIKRIAEGKKGECTGIVWGGTGECAEYYPDKVYSFDKYVNMYMDNSSNFEEVLSNEEYGFNEFNIKFDDWWYDSYYKIETNSLVGYQHLFFIGEPPKYSFKINVKIGSFTFKFEASGVLLKNWNTFMSFNWVYDYIISAV